MKEGEYMQLVLIYPKYPLKNIVDPDWEEEYNAVSKIQELETGLYDDYEKLLIINDNTLSNDEYIYLYRGWMLNPEEHLSLVFPQYKWFSDDIQSKTANSGFFWSNLLEPFIIGPTLLYSNDFLENLLPENNRKSLDTLSQNLYSLTAPRLGNSIFVKDGVKSETNPVISSAEELTAVLSQMTNHVGEFRDGLIFKPAVEVKNEKRFFCFLLDNDILIFPSYNMEKNEKEFLNKIAHIVTTTLGLNFFTLDTAYVKDRLVLIELGHGEYSSLKDINPEYFADILGFMAKKL